MLARQFVPWHLSVEIVRVAAARRGAGGRGRVGPEWPLSGVTCSVVHVYSWVPRPVAFRALSRTRIEVQIVQPFSLF